MKKLFLLLFLIPGLGLFAIAQDIPLKEKIETLQPAIDNLIVGKVLIGDTDINLEQIKAGLAWHDKQYAAGEQHPTDRALYAAAETKARNARLGLWSQKATAPWDWQRGDDQAPPAESRTTPQTKEPASSRTYVKASRGGCYYVNRNGNKTYVDRSLCG